MTRTSLLLLIVLLLTAGPASAQDANASQGAVVESVEVTGVSRDELSPGLRRDLDALSGTRLSRDAASALALRIEAERPDVIAAIREVPQADGRVRVVFVIARVAQDSDLAANINARYLVENVEISGIQDERISQDLRNDLQALVGRRLEDEEMNRLSKRLKDEQPDYDVGHRVSRGKEPGHIQVVFVLKRSESSWWVPYTSERSQLVYHADQGWSGSAQAHISGERNDVSIGLSLRDNDSLVEEFSGFSITAQNREAGTRRLGMGLKFSRYTQTWNDATLDALAADLRIPDPYRVRLTVEPTVTVAILRHVRFSAGVSASQLDPLAASVAGTRHANAALAAVSFGQGWRPQYPVDTHPRTPVRHRLDAGYQLRAARDGLNSDFTYTRHSARASYRASHKNSTFIAEFMAGGISGRSPLFERFTLGDSVTLRGWNKYDIVPAGADRVIHQSVEYRFHGFAYFLDAGSVWSAGDDRKVRLSTGVGFHRDHFFATLSVPLNADKMRAVVIVGVR